MYLSTSVIFKFFAIDFIVIKNNSPLSRYKDQFVVATFDSAPTADAENYSKLDKAIQDKHESRVRCYWCFMGLSLFQQSKKRIFFSFAKSYPLHQNLDMTCLKDSIFGKFRVSCML